jgi:hypothetical protein
MGLPEHAWTSSGALALLFGCQVCGAWAAWMRWCWITNPTHNPTRYRATVLRCHAHASPQGEPDATQDQDGRGRERPTS